MGWEIGGGVEVGEVVRGWFFFGGLCGMGFGMRGGFGWCGLIVWV